MATVWRADPLWTQQIGGCAGILPGAPTHLTSGTQPLANEASRCSSSSLSCPALKCVGRDGVCNDGRRQKQEHLWQQFFLDPTVWWDNRRDRKSSHFRRKGSGEVLWLNNMFKPAWVDEQLVSLDMQMGHGASSSGRRQEQEQEQEHLWQQFFLDPTMWWDNRLDTKGSHFRCKGSGEVLWLNSMFKPAWVDEKLVSLDMQMGHGASPSKSSSLDKPEPGGREGLRIGVATAGTVSMLCQEGKLSEAVGALETLAETDSAIPQSLFYTVLKLCTAKKDLVVGRRVHDLTVKLGYESNAYLGNHILRMYASGGRLEEAMDVLIRVSKPDAYMWFSIISAYAKHGKPKEAIQLYHEMSGSGVKADAHVFVATLQACAFAADLESGRKVHNDVVQSGILTNLFVGTSLVDMYAKCGELKDARRVFDSLAIKNVVTWTALIAGYAQQGLGHEALVACEQMEEEGLILADDFIFACLLKACASTGALQKGRQLHSLIVETGLLDDILLGTCLVDMYAKCGDLKAARQTFDSLATKDVVTWTALISGYGACDEGHKAVACFEEMLVAGIQPNDATFTCLLVACSHEGLVDEGRKHFDLMAEQHGIKPTTEHYNCMIDLLGRAGHIDEAENMLLSCEGQSNVVGLMSLLNACKLYGDIERATWCFDRVVRLDPQQASAYVLMANSYADAGRWTDVDRIEIQRRVAGANKKPAVATIEVKKQIHTFEVGERRDDIALKVESTNARLKQEGGHVPHTKLVLKPLCEKEKEDMLCGHAEKLALAFGLLNTPSGTPLVVTKNLRMCSDCHSSTEILSRLEHRDIVVRDGYRVHRFANGCCSCKGRP